MNLHGLAVVDAPWRSALLHALGVGWLLLITCLLWWVITLSANRRTRKRASARVFWVLLCLVSVQWVDLATLPEVEWNPLHVPAEEFLGTYSDGKQTITFHSDGRYSAANIQGVPDSGDWKMDDWNIYLSSGRTMRHIQVEGRNHVLPEEIGDLDGWHGEVGLPKAAEASRR